jgi:hypothetical protein
VEAVSVASGRAALLATGSHYGVQV